MPQNLNITPSSVNSFVSSINGKSPGKTEKKKSLSPDTVPEVNFFGLATIIIIMAKIKMVKIVSPKKE